MKTANKMTLILAGLIGFASSIACSSGTGTGMTEESARSATNELDSFSELVVGSIVLAGGHRVDFFAPAAGLTSIAEVGPTGSPRVVTEEMLANHKLSEIYVQLKGAGALAPRALLDAEAATPVDVAPPPASEATGATGGQPAIQFYTASQASWFESTYCVVDWNCVTGYSWLFGSSGNHKGRGYAVDGMQGSEATGNRNLEADWWNGSSWVPLSTISMCPGCTAWISAGNVGSCSGSSSSWFFKSEIPDNGDGTSATVDMADHVYAGCGYELLTCIVNGSYQTQSCGGAPPSPCQSKSLTTSADYFCPFCNSTDYCANPP